MGEGVIITYETLFDILRREKSRDELQELDQDFYKNVAGYLAEKKALLESSSDEFMDEHEKIRIQITNIKKIIKELYERRERKIVNLAMFKARLKNKILDTRALLPEEQVLFQELTENLSQKRESLLESITMNSRNGFAKKEPSQESSETNKKSYEQEDTGEEQRGPTAAVQPADQDEENKMIRFTNPVPKFLGTELEVYGPYEEEDVANLPRQIADILIQKGRAEEIAK